MNDIIVEKKNLFMTNLKNKNNNDIKFSAIDTFSIAKIGIEYLISIKCSQFIYFMLSISILSLLIISYTFKKKVIHWLEDSVDKTIIPIFIMDMNFTF